MLKTALGDLNDDSSDGRIIVVLCDTEEDRLGALNIIAKTPVSEAGLTLVAVPRPLNVLVGLIQEVQRWNWVMTNTPELNHDRYAATEVSRQFTAAQHMLKQADRPTDLRWFRSGVLLKIQNGKQLLATLSSICDECYPLAPNIKNELVNRRQLSSAAAAARMRLIERIFTHPEFPRLGFDEGKTPPEVSMYLSVLLESGLHDSVGHGWKLKEPDESADVCKVLPSMRHLLEVLNSAKAHKAPISEVIQSLRKAPYGVRDGLAFLLLAVFAQIREQDLAFYENGSFMRQVGGEDFLRIVKDPASFEIQFYEMNAVRTDLFRRLSTVLQLPVSERGRVELLDIVRPLCQFASNLPLYTQKTARLDEGSLNVRRALLDAREPATLLFENLPQALSLAAEDALATKMEDFVDGLKTSLESLRAAYPDLLERIDLYIGLRMQVTKARLDRPILATRARALLISTTEPRLRAFCIQLGDESLGDTEWLESLASLACSKPPSKWLDRDIEMFEQELSQMAAGLLRLESLLFSKRKQKGNDSAFRVAITLQDGYELERVIYLNSGQKIAAKKLESRIIKILEGEQAEGEAALAQAFWQVFGSKVVSS
jgi:hypothetical protein